MARPTKEGLEYFPIVTNFEDKVILLIAEFGASAVGIIVSLYQKIYSNGYYISWDNDSLMLFSRYINEEIETVNAVITRCFDRGVFNKTMYEKHGILTSHGIQKQYLKICKEARRKKVRFIKEYCLIDDNDLLNVITELTSINTEETPVNDSDNTQSKVKESKEKKTTTTTTVHSTVTGTPENGQAAAAINFFEQNIGILSPLVAEKLNAWIDDTEEALVLFALEKAILAGKHNFSYAEGILRNWANQGIRTRHAAEMAEREFQRQKEQSRHPPPGAKKHPEDRPLTPEEKKRLEELNIELAKIGKEMNFSP
jgi:DnaD/phage-associated family protein